LKIKIISILAILALVVGFIFFYFLYSTKDVKYYDVENEKIKLRISSNWNSQDVKSQIYQELIADFNSSSNDTQIINDYIPGNNFFSRLKADFASGNDPDIFISWPGETTNKLAAAGKIVSFNDSFRNDPKWNDSFDKSIWRYIVDNGNVNGIPLEKTYIGFFVNNDVLKSVGLSIPTTFDELKADIPILRAHSITPIAFSISENGLLLYKCIAASLGGKFNACYIYSNGSLNEYYSKASEYVKKLYNMNAFPSNLFTISENERDSLFIKKKAAFTVQYSSFLETLYKNDSDIDNISITSFPQFSEGLSTSKAALYGVSMDTLFVSSKSWNDSEKHDKILAALKYFTSEDTATKLNIDLGAVTAVKTQSALAYSSSPVYKKNYDFIRDISEIIDFPDYYVDSDVLLHVSDEFPKFLIGSEKIEDVWKYAYNYAYNN